MAHFKYRFFTKSRKENGNFFFSEIPTDVEYNEEVGFRDGKFSSPKKFECNLYQSKVSAGLVETNTLLVLADDGTANSSKVGTVNSIAADVPDYQDALDNNWKLFAFIDTHNQEDLRFYTVNHESGEVVWTDRLLIDLRSDNIAFNIGFVGDKDGQYENKVYFCEVQTSKNDPSELTGMEMIEHVGTINVYSTAVGEDERYRTLFENFGIPDPISYMDVFKDETKSEHDTAVNDPMMNYDTLNKRSKQLFLSYDQIFPFVGTYKALVNAVDFLGYDDIYFKEWYRELSETKGVAAQLVAYNVNYKNGGNSLLSQLPLEKRILLKKTNWLSMIYKISEEVLNDEGDIEYEVLPDNVCFPITKTNYDLYNSDEILVKLIGLKTWLENNIIGIHCRIIDIGGEGIVFERYKDKIYGKVGQGLEMFCEETLSPYLYNYTGNIELEDTGADIHVGVKELTTDPGFTERMKDMTIRLSMSSNTAVLGLYDASINSEDQDASVYDMGIVDMSLIVSDGEIFFDPKLVYETGNDMTSNFVRLPSISIESARLRDPNVEWDKSICYEISNAYDGKYQIVQYNDGEYGSVIATKSEYIYLRPSQFNDPTLKYSTNNMFGVPLFMLSNYYDYALGDLFEENKEYVLEILDGKMSFIEEYTDKYGEVITRTTYLNFHFDTDANEQSIEVNYVYEKNAYPKDLIDPKTGEAKCVTINVKNTGDYIAYVYGVDEYGTIYGARCSEPATVVIKNPNIIVYSTTKETNNTPDFYIVNQCAEEPIPYSATTVRSDGTVVQFKDIDPEKEYQNGSSEPISKKNYLIHDVNVEETSSNGMVVQYATYPSISYSADTPKQGDFVHFINVTDKFVYDHKDTSGKLYMRRVGDMKANTLDTGVLQNGQSTELVRKANLIIYDNLHNKPIVQQEVMVHYDASIEMSYVYIDTSSSPSDTLWYLEGSTYKKVRYKNDADRSLDTVRLSQNALPDSGITYSLDDIIQMSSTFTTYLQAIYELAYSVETTQNDGTSLLRLVSGQGQVPNINGVDIFYKGQVIELKQVYNLGPTKLQKVSSARIVSVGKHGKTLTVKAPFMSFSNDSNIVYISHAHKAFVDYVFDVKETVETKEGKTKLFVMDDTYLNFVDNTFSIYSIEYDVNTAHSIWTESHQVNNDTVPSWVNPNSISYIYKHDIPFTIQSGQSVVVKGTQLLLENTGMHCQWVVYLYDLQNDTNVKMLESWNDTLFLTPTRKGIYSISLRVFDDYGNDSKTIREGAFRVV